MDAYKARTIEFKELITIDDWHVKVYTITKHVPFNYPVFYNNVRVQLKSWLKQDNHFDSSNDKIAFLILHAGNEGIFSIINWWVGKNMLNTNIYITAPEKPDDFKKISGNGLAPCIWELEVINHERLSWITNVLKQNTHPDYSNYLADTISCEI